MSGKAVIIQLTSAETELGNICWPWLELDQIKFQSLLAGESDVKMAPNSAKSYDFEGLSCKVNSW